RSAAVARTRDAERFCRRGDWRLPVDGGGDLDGTAARGWLASGAVVPVLGGWAPVAVVPAVARCLRYRVLALPLAADGRRSGGRGQPAQLQDSRHPWPAADL